MVETDLDTLDAVVAEFRALRDRWKQTLSPHLYRVALIEVAEQCEIDDDTAEDETPLHGGAS